jgi:hypothetical protein
MGLIEMAKIEKKKKPEAPVEDFDFAKLCADFRSAKVQSKKFDDQVSKLGGIIKKYASENGLHGDMNGVKITRRLSFASKESVRAAELASLDVPYMVSASFCGSPENVGQIAGKVEKLLAGTGIVLSVSKYVDDKALEQLMKQTDVEPSYYETLAIGLSTVE